MFFCVILIYVNTSGVLLCLGYCQGAYKTVSDLGRNMVSSRERAERNVGGVRHLSEESRYCQVGLLCVVGVLRAFCGGRWKKNPGGASQLDPAVRTS